MTRRDDDLDELRRAGRWHDVVRVLTARTGGDVAARVRDLNEAAVVLLERFGNEAEALRCFEASLALDADQPSIASALRELLDRRRR